MVGQVRSISCLWNMKEGNSKRINRSQRLPLLLKSSGVSFLYWVESG